MSIFSTLKRSFQDCVQLQKTLNRQSKERKRKRKIKSLPVVEWTPDMVRHTRCHIFHCLISHQFLQDNKLIEGMHRCGVDGWALIAASMSDMDLSDEQCRARYDVMANRLRAAPFTAEEVM